MRNFVAVSFVTLLLVLGSSQDPRTLFTPVNLSPMDWDPSTVAPPTEQEEICSATEGVTTGDQGTITKDLASGQCLNVTSPNHPGNYPNSGSSFLALAYICTMMITIPPSQGMTLKLLKDSFEFEGKLDSLCLFDFLELENIFTTGDVDVANDRFCGTLTNDKALDSTPEVAFVTLKFRADIGNGGKGFLATLCVP